MENKIFTRKLSATQQYTSCVPLQY